MINSGLLARGLVLIGALVAGPLFAQSLAKEANKELPDWLQVGGLYRARFEGFLNRNFKTMALTFTFSIASALTSLYAPLAG